MSRRIQAFPLNTLQPRSGNCPGGGTAEPPRHTTEKLRQCIIREHTKGETGEVGDLGRFQMVTVTYEFMGTFARCVVQGFPSMTY
jgi:hypothetical protein